MVDDMVLRSVYLRLSEDAQLRQLAHELNVSKSDLVRSAIAVKLADWLKSNDRSRILEDIEHGKRDEAAIRSGRGGRRRMSAAPTTAESQTPAPKSSSRASKAQRVEASSSARASRSQPVGADG